MKATDLMIGDWVKCEDPKCEGHQVDLIDLCNEEVGLDGEIDNFENIIPIPLTPEILEKNFGRPYGLGWYDVYELKRIEGEGIYYIRDAYRYPSKERFSIIKADDKEITFCSLKYVHELQHALKLCGIEKEIVL